MPFDKINKKDIAPELLEDFTIISNVEKLMKK